MTKSFFPVLLCSILCFLAACSTTGGGKTAQPGDAMLIAAAGHPPVAGAGVQARADYRIGVGDVLTISVWKDDALTRQVVVLPDGSLSFPLVGRIQAEGASLEELKEKILQRLAKYVPDPTLSIDVSRISSLVIYVIGKVNRPGRFDLMDNINILQALALAGGTNPFAKTGRIKVFRETPQGTTLFLFDYDEVAEGKHLEQNIELQRGDVIVVP